MEKKKQMIFTVLAVLLLIGTTVGVTYAFFTYSKTGDKNNVLTTGTLNFLYSYDNTSGNGINIQNALPTTVGVGQALNGTNETFTFSVSGTAPLNTTINYTMYARSGDDITSKYRFLDSEIGIYLVASGNDATHTVNLPYTAGTLKTVGQLTGSDLVNSSTRAANTSNRKTLGTGSIIGQGTASATVNYTLRMWVTDAVSIGDSGTETYRSSSSGTGTNKVYGDMYYSLKVDVEASA